MNKLKVGSIAGVIILFILLLSWSNSFSRSTVAYMTPVGEKVYDTNQIQRDLEVLYNQKYEIEVQRYNINKILDVIVGQRRET